MTYSFAVYVGPVLMKRTLTHSKALRIAATFNGKAVVKQEAFNSKGGN